MSGVAESSRVPVMQMSPTERRDYLTKLDPASRKRTEELLGIKLEGGSAPSAAGG